MHRLSRCVVSASRFVFPCTRRRAFLRVLAGAVQRPHSAYPVHCTVHKRACSTASVRKGHELDVKRLSKYLSEYRALQGNDFSALEIEYFTYGQSNPTYLLKTACGTKLVLRKQPPGKLLRGAHDVAREYKIMHALRGILQVPAARLLCLNEDVVGTDFFVYEYVDGRVIKDIRMAADEYTAADRTQAYRSFAGTLAKLHAVDVEAAGLSDLSSKPHLFVGRQVSTWTKQYRASETDTMKDMDVLIEWLPQYLPEDAGDVQTLFHGDFRLDNILFSGSTGQTNPSSPSGLHVAAVLDWELATIGHPMLDLAHACLPYYLPELPGSPITGFVTPREGKTLDEELAARGIPTLPQFLTDYCAGLSRNACQTSVCVTSPDQALPKDWEYYVALALFRAAAILQGVKKRSLQGNAAAANAGAVGKLAAVCAKVGVRVARLHEKRQKESPVSKTTDESDGTAGGAAGGGAADGSSGSGAIAGSAGPSKASTSASTNASTGSKRAARLDGSLGPLADPLVGVHMSDRAREALSQVRRMVEEEIVPLEQELLGEDYYLNRGDFAADGGPGGKRWDPHHDSIEALKNKAKEAGLFNAFLPPALSSGLAGEANPGFSVLEYAPMAEAMGRSLLAPEVFNCNAPDTGNMEVFAVAASEEQQRRWLAPLLDGKIRSCFGMTEPQVASSDATNMQTTVEVMGTDESPLARLPRSLAAWLESASAKEEGGEATIDRSWLEGAGAPLGGDSGAADETLTLHGRKWWTSGAMDPRCEVMICLVKDRAAVLAVDRVVDRLKKDGRSELAARLARRARHFSHSMVLVPMDAPGVEVLRPLTVMGFDDAPHGHAEVLLDNVQLKASEALLEDHGAGFSIAQRRLGPGRIHHAMRLLGMSERSLELMLDRTEQRVAFGRPLSSRDTIRHQVARARIDIDQARLLTLAAARAIDEGGPKAAKSAVGMIKVVAPEVALRVMDQAMQAHGGMGLSQDTPIAHMWTWARALRLADGPDEVHLESLARDVYAGRS